MSIVVWVLIGVGVAAAIAPNNRYAVPSGRPACLLGGMAGAFLGGGVLTVATGSDETCVHGSSSAAAACGALLIVVAVGWAGRA